MKKLIALIILLTIGFELSAQNCFEGRLPTYNGVQPSSEVPTEDITFADLKVGPKTKVEYLKDSDRLKFTAEILCTSVGNNAAWNLKAIITLPGEVEVISYTIDNQDVTPCFTWGNPGNTDSRVVTGFLTFNKKSLDRNQSFVITVETTKALKRKAAGLENFSVFVMSQIPDNEPSNNFWSSESSKQ